MTPAGAPISTLGFAGLTALTVYMVAMLPFVRRQHCAATGAVAISWTSFVRLVTAGEVLATGQVVRP